MHSANPRAGTQSVRQEEQQTGAEGTQRKTIRSEQNQIRHTPQIKMERVELNSTVLPPLQRAKHCISHTDHQMQFLKVRWWFSCQNDFKDASAWREELKTRRLDWLCNLTGNLQTFLCVDLFVFISTRTMHFNNSETVLDCSFLYNMSKQVKHVVLLSLTCDAPLMGAPPVHCFLLSVTGRH